MSAFFLNKSQRLYLLLCVWDIFRTTHPIIKRRSRTVNVAVVNISMYTCINIIYALHLDRGELNLSH